MSTPGWTRKLGAVLLSVMACAGCGGGGNDAKAEAHVCGYLITDATDGSRQALLDFQSGGGGTSVVDDLTQTAKQVREDVSTLPSGDKIRVAGEAVAKSNEDFAAALTANRGVQAAANALQGPGDRLQTLCRAVTP